MWWFDFRRIFWFATTSKTTNVLWGFPHSISRKEILSKEQRTPCKWMSITEKRSVSSLTYLSEFTSKSSGGKSQHPFHALMSSISCRHLHLIWHLTFYFASTLHLDMYSESSIFAIHEWKCPCWSPVQEEIKFFVQATAASCRRLRV